MATGTARVYPGHLLVSGKISKGDKKLYKMLSPGLANIWPDNLEKSPFTREMVFYCSFPISASTTGRTKPEIKRIYALK